MPIGLVLGPRRCRYCDGLLPPKSGPTQYCSEACKEAQRIVEECRKPDRLWWLERLFKDFRQRVAHRNQGHMHRLNDLQKEARPPQDELHLEKRGTTSGGGKSKRARDDWNPKVGDL